MESMFLWIVLFSGATVLLLGLFLVASEKELKKKRGEINDLVTRLDGARTASAPASSEGGGNGAEVTGLRAKNQELKKEMALLQDDLDAAHRAIDELRSNQPAAANGATLGEIAQLRNANSQLDAQVEELRRQLEASAAQLETASAADRGASERQTQLENALIDLKQQLEKSQAQVRQLESSPTPVVDASASEASHQEESQRLQARIAELENRLERRRRNYPPARHPAAAHPRVGEAGKRAARVTAAARRRDSSSGKSGSPPAKKSRSACSPCSRFTISWSPNKARSSTINAPIMAS